MMILVWPLLFYLGYKSEHVGWLRFVAMMVVALALTLVYDHYAIENAARLGEDESFRYQPIVVAGDTAITFALWSGTHLLGYYFGRRKRRGRAD